MLNRLRNMFFDVFFDVRRGEGARVAGLAAFFFLVIAVFWVLKPMKRGLILSFYAGGALEIFGWGLSGAEAEQLAKVLNVAGAYGTVVGFTLLGRRFGRGAVYVLCAGMAGGMAFFAAYVAEPAVWTVWAFYFFGDLFNTVMVVAFWAFTNDVIRPEQARRLYGPIGLGGVVGGFVGATVVRAQVEAWGRPALLLVCVAAMGLVAAAAYFVSARSPHVSLKRNTGPAAPLRAVVTEGARLALSSKYLLSILALVGLYEIVSNVVDFQLATMVEAHVAPGAARDAFFGLVGQVTGVASILVQVFVTGSVMKRYGVGAALLFLPACLLLGSVGFLFVPVLGMAAVMSASDNALNYSVNQSAKEALYTPTTRAEKYQAKAFIDMFVQRFAKVFAVGLNLAFAAFVGAQGVRWLSLVSIALLLAWTLVVRFAGQRFEEKSAEQRARGDGEASVPEDAVALMPRAAPAERRG